jgi:hypothetical protein
MTSPRFEVFADSNLVGYSELEWGDPPMGVAGARFFPLSAYEVIQPLAVAARDTSQAHLALSVQTPDGRTIPAQGGVQIIDYSSELGDEGLEVHPGRHAAYVESFRKNP